MWTNRFDRVLRVHRFFVGAVLVAALSTGLASVSAAQTPAPYVKVFVDAGLVTFDQPPVIAGGRVLVPLRGVFERLGATVAWDPASETVLAQRGATSVSLRIGSPQVFVDGQAQVLDVPAMLVGGRTLVPLRFVSQALGAAVAWDAASYTVQIFSQAAATPPPAAVPPSQTYPPAPAYPQAPVYPPASAPATKTITGTVTQVNAAAYPGQLIVQAPDGTISTYQIVSGTAITRTNTTTGVTGPISLSALRNGDLVTVTADQTGTAQSVQASFGQVNGTIASAGYNQIVLQNGQVYTLSSSVQVVRGGTAVTPAALQPGDVVTLRTDPQTGQVTLIAVRREAGGGVYGGITSVTVTPTGRRLGAGDVITVIVQGPAHGAATFTITGLRAGLAMTESAPQPGTYIGNYAVQPGDYVAAGRVVVSLTAPNGQLLTATAPAPVSINSSAITPPAVGGAPVIINPAAGSGITTPFIVSGTAPPYSFVRVSANYAGNVLLFNVTGSLGSEVVQADARGTWSATFNRTPPVHGVTVTIDAMLVDQSGTARSPTTSIDTTLQ